MIGPAVGLGRGILWANGETGHFDFSAENSSLFTEFEAFATNGVNNKFTIFTLWSDGTGTGGGGAESGLFGRHPPINHPPDLIGYDLDTVRLIVNRLDITSWTPPSGSDGLAYSYHVIYEFYGTPVPEPGIFLPILVGFIALSKGANRERSLRVRTS